MLNTVCWEDLHSIIPVQGVDILLNAIAINKELEVSKVPNHVFEDRLREIDLGWLRDTLMDLTERKQVY